MKYILLLLVFVVLGCSVEPKCPEDTYENPNWEKLEEPILSCSGLDDRFDRDYTGGPLQIIKESGRYYLYFDGGNLIRPDEAFGLACSTNISNGYVVVESTGKNKSLFNLGAPEDYDYNRTWGGPVLKEGSIWKIWNLGDCGGNDLQPYHHSRLGYATSSDGVIWNKYKGTNYGGCIFEDFSEGPQGINSAAIMEESGTYYMWYSPMYTEKLKLAASTDGISWAIVASANGFGSVGNVIKVGNTYYMCANALNKNGTNGVAIYTSTDKINWEYRERIGMHSVYEWQNGYMASPCLFQDSDGQIYLFYQAGKAGAQNNNKTLRTIKIGCAKLKSNVFQYTGWNCFNRLMGSSSRRTVVK